MNQVRHAARKDPSGTIYEIRIRGQLDESWADWFSGMTVTVCDETASSRTTILRGAIVDQAALQGILLRIHDLNLELISVAQVKSEATGEDLPGSKGDVNHRHGK